MELWNNTTTLAKAALVTPYVFILLGALVAASGIYLKGVIEKRVATIVDKEKKEKKNPARDEGLDRHCNFRWQAHSWKDLAPNHSRE